MKLIIQPGDGIERLVKGIRKARKSVEVMIFRFDRPEIERALIDAAERGLFVHALIAFTNRGGEQSLRKLEMRLLASGISVARTAGDLVRYHGKMMIVDRKELYVLSFNFTRLDINRSRGFGLVTRNPKLVAEAIKLFEADTKRQMYSAGNAKFLVSPVNARKELSRFIKGAKKELLVYDPKVSDRAMLRLLDDRRKAGVEMRIIGYVSNKRFPVAELKRIRLHTRTIVRDRADAFIGSQSLRQLELDARREIGIIFRDHAVVKSLIRTFEDDWAASTPDGSADEETPRQVSTKKAVKKIAKLVTRNISLAPVSHKVTRAIARVTDVDVQDKKIQRTMEEAVKTAVEQTARDVVKEAVKAVADAG